MPLTTITCSPSSASWLSSAAGASCARAREGAKVNESADVASNTLFAAQDLEITILSPSKHPLDVVFCACAAGYPAARHTPAHPERLPASLALTHTIHRRNITHTIHRRNVLSLAQTAQNGYRGSCGVRCTSAMPARQFRSDADSLGAASIRQAGLASHKFVPLVRSAGPVVAQYRPQCRSCRGCRGRIIVIGERSASFAAGRPMNDRIA